jgi:hypothetical protein
MQQVQVKYIFDKTSIYDVEAIDTILSLKEKIRQREGIPVDGQKLKLVDVELENQKTFADYDINNNDIVTIIMRFPGTY